MLGFVLLHFARFAHIGAATMGFPRVTPLLVAFGDDELAGEDGSTLCVTQGSRRPNSGADFGLTFTSNCTLVTTVTR
uniref:Putative secreted peptide n=1 Tax=Anopheles braziliensis TaxID=58242 RepID=A0A2M3ZR26_9DIPT